MSDDLYRHFLSSTLIEDEGPASGTHKDLLPNRNAYQDLQLWYLNGNTVLLVEFPRYRWNRQSLCADLQLWHPRPKN